jgi:hypothetical protein
MTPVANLLRPIDLDALETHLETLIVLPQLKLESLTLAGM